jgi:hypothetical protein
MAGNGQSHYETTTGKQKRGCFYGLIAFCATSPNTAIEGHRSQTPRRALAKGLLRRSGSR